MAAECDRKAALARLVEAIGPISAADEGPSGVAGRRPVR